MKFLGLVALMGLLSLSTNAGWSSADELTDYQKPGYTILGKGTLTDIGIPNKGVYTKFGTVFTNITNVCIDGNTFRTIQDVRICSQWGFKPESCDNDGGPKDCFDRDERVCEVFSNVPGQSVVRGTKQVCARPSSREAFQWKLANPEKKFKSEFPKCSVFKTVSANSPTSFDFLIVKDGNENSMDYRSSLDGVLVDEITFTYPSCN